MHDDDLELTTQMVAAILNVSRPFVCKLVDDGKLPARRVGRHRRIRWGDFNAFQRVFEAERDAAMTELSALSEEMELSPKK